MSILKTKRKSMGFTLQQMADKLGLDVANVSRYENYIRIYKTNELLRVQQIYQLTDDELLEYIRSVSEIKNSKERSGK